MTTSDKLRAAEIGRKIQVRLLAGRRLKRFRPLSSRRKQSRQLAPRVIMLGWAQMRLLLARLWLLLPLLLLLQASGAAESAWPTNQRTASYLPGDSSHSHGARSKMARRLNQTVTMPARGVGRMHRSAVHRGVSWSPGFGRRGQTFGCAAAVMHCRCRALRFTRFAGHRPWSRLREPT